jgi:hypothetical protein
LGPLERANLDNWTHVLRFISIGALFTGLPRSTLSKNDVSQEASNILYKEQHMRLSIKNNFRLDAKNMIYFK